MVPGQDGTVIAVAEDLACAPLFAEPDSGGGSDVMDDCRYRTVLHVGVETPSGLQPADRLGVLGVLDDVALTACALDAEDDRPRILSFAELAHDRAPPVRKNLEQCHVRRRRPTVEHARNHAG